MSSLNVNEPNDLDEAPAPVPVSEGVVDAPGDLFESEEAEDKAEAEDLDDDEVGALLDIVRDDGESPGTRFKAVADLLGLDR